ncbi:PREDICTED: CTP synthase-like isoform X1 [Nicrophorus vespilloides]|uniref:CTP synthase n=1 Tax=Nicrophorus vespilloides TaxID=110193 RepID=A0ABM1MTM5_NICVS|nr:PREDICTED: CTP synthase-like isoform X1 [Nicrophorus vespilloides]
MMSNMKYILVTGGVISGVGKGVISSSFGTILKCCGIEVTSIKIDPYINLDAGTFSPYEHGEVYVLDDGGEVDLDLGNYERFLDITLHRDNNITTGKIYQMVIDRERHGDYLGKTVQVVPHITDAIQEWVERVAKVPVSKTGKTPEVCIIELGGTIGDIESMAFVEAFRQFQFRVKRENFCTAHVSLVPQPRSTGEQKTKPTQASVRELRGLGLSPDIIVCRSEKAIDQSVRNKISNFCHVAPEQVICIQDLSSIYKVPILMESHGIVEYLNERLQLGINPMLPARKFMKQWIDLSEKIENLRNEVEIAIVGKYTRLEDSYTSVTKAVQHAANAAGFSVKIKFIEASNLENEMKQECPASYHEAWHDLVKTEGVIVPGGFGKRGVEGKIAAANWCRVNNKPYLGICLGFQTAVIEFARNVLKLEGANTAECEEVLEHPIIIDMPEHNTGQMGGTMRLGKRSTVFKQSASSSKIMRLYNNRDMIEERHRHRYEVNPKYIKDLEAGGLEFVGVDVEGTRMEIFELKKHPYFVATQFHPEYLSRPMTPSPPFMGLILAAKDRLKPYLIRGCKLSPRQEYDYDESEDEEVCASMVQQLNLARVPESDGSSAYSSSSSML